MSEIRPTAFSPANRRGQNFSTPVPSGVTAPMPVITTRPDGTGRSLKLLLALAKLFADVIDGVADGLDLSDLFVGNVDAELVFKCHNEFDDV
jgi:hypothetical protein